jgi:ribose transport system substrate-binding protein
MNRCLLMVAAALAVAGCSKKANNTAGGASPAGGKMRTFAVIPKQLNNPVFNMAKQGAEAEAKKLGDVRINWTAPQQMDAAQQVSIVNSLVAAKVDGIAISCADAAALTPAINNAVAAGIPVVTWDADAPDSKRSVFFGVNDYEAGKKGGELLKKELPNGGDIAILTGSPGAENLNERIRGFKAATQGAGFKILSTLPCNDDIAKSISIVRDFPKSHPTMKGWYMAGGWPLFAEAPGPFADAKPGQYKVVAFDTLKPELAYIRQGYVDGLIGQKYTDWGAKSVEILDGLTKGKTFPKFVDSGMDVVTRANMDAFLKDNPR